MTGGTAGRVVPTGLGSIFRLLTRHLRAGLSYAAPAGLGLIGFRRLAFGFRLRDLRVSVS